MKSSIPYSLTLVLALSSNTSFAFNNSAVMNTLNHQMTPLPVSNSTTNSGTGTFAGSEGNSTLSRQSATAAAPSGNSKLAETVDGTANGKAAEIEKTDPCKTAMGKSDEDTLAKVKSEVDAKIKNLKSATFAKLNLAEKVGKLVQRYVDKQKTCTTNQPKATKACLSSYSPEMQMATMMANQLFSSGASAVNDSCNKSSKLFGMMQAGLNGYIAACEATKLSCNSACNSGIDALKDLEKLISGVKVTCPTSTNPQDPEVIACTGDLAIFNPIQAKIAETVKPEITDDGKCISMAGKKRVCGVDYANMILGGTQSLMAIANAFKKSSGCDDESTTGITTPVVTTTDVDCTKSENAGNEKCICLANPRLSGCSSTLAGLNGNSSSRLPSTSSASASGVGEDAIKAGDIGSGVNGIQAIEPSNAAGAGSSLRGGGYGGGAGGLSGGGGAGDPKAAAAGAAPLDTNVLSGEGGGGGYSGGFGGGSAALEKALEEEKKDLEDPNKVAAMEWAKQVAPESGRSNFERVRDRYNANRRTLMQK